MDGDVLNLTRRYDAKLALIMSAMGPWLAGLVRELAATPDWHEKTEGRKGADLRFAVVCQLGRISKENDELFKAYFHQADGTWEVLLAEVMKTHSIR